MRCAHRKRVSHGLNFQRCQALLARFLSRPHQNAVSLRPHLRSLSSGVATKAHRASRSHIGFSRVFHSEDARVSVATLISRRSYAAGLSTSRTNGSPLPSLSSLAVSHTSRSLSTVPGASAASPSPTALGGASGNGKNPNQSREGLDWLSTLENPATNNKDLLDVFHRFSKSDDVSQAGALDRFALEFSRRGMLDACAAVRKLSVDTKLTLSPASEDISLDALSRLGRLEELLEALNANKQPLSSKHYGYVLSCLMTCDFVQGLLPTIEEMYSRGMQVENGLISNVHRRFTEKGDANSAASLIKMLRDRQASDTHARDALRSIESARTSPLSLRNEGEQSAGVRQPQTNSPVSRPSSPHPQATSSSDRPISPQASGRLSSSARTSSRALGKLPENATANEVLTVVRDCPSAQVDSLLDDFVSLAGGSLQSATRVPVPVDRPVLRRLMLRIQEQARATHLERKAHLRANKPPESLPSFGGVTASLSKLLAVARGRRLNNAHFYQDVFSSLRLPNSDEVSACILDAVKSDGVKFDSETLRRVKQSIPIAMHERLADFVIPVAPSANAENSPASKHVVGATESEEDFCKSISSLATHGRHADLLKAFEMMISERAKSGEPVLLNEAVFAALYPHYFTRWKVLNDVVQKIDKWTRIHRVKPDPSWNARKHLLTQSSPSILSSVMPMHKHNGRIRALIAKHRNGDAFALYQSLLDEYEKSVAPSSGDGTNNVSTPSSSNGTSVSTPSSSDGTNSVSSFEVFRPDHTTFALAVTVLRRMDGIDRLPSVFDSMKRLGVVPNKLVFDQLVDPFGTFHALDLRSVMLNVNPSSWETITTDATPDNSSSHSISPAEEWNLMVENFEKFVAHHTAPLLPPRDVADEEIASRVTIPEAFRICWWFLRDHPETRIPLNLALKAVRGYKALPSFAVPILAGATGGLSDHNTLSQVFSCRELTQPEVFFQFNHYLKECPPEDTQALNTFLRAAVSLEEFQAATGIFCKSVHPRTGCTPNGESFEILTRAVGGLRPKERKAARSAHSDARRKVGHSWEQIAGVLVGDFGRDAEQFMYVAPPRLGLCLVDLLSRLDDKGNIIAKRSMSLEQEEAHQRESAQLRRKLLSKHVRNKPTNPQAQTNSSPTGAEPISAVHPSRTAPRTPLEESAVTECETLAQCVALAKDALRDRVPVPSDVSRRFLQQVLTFADKSDKVPSTGVDGQVSSVGGALREWLALAQHQLIARVDPDQFQLALQVASRIQEDEQRNAVFALCHALLTPLPPSEIPRFLSPVAHSQMPSSKPSTREDDTSRPPSASSSHSRQSESIRTSDSHMVPPPPAVVPSTSLPGGLTLGSSSVLSHYVSLFGIRTVVDMLVYLHAPAARDFLRSNGLTPVLTGLLSRSRNVHETGTKHIPHSNFQASSDLPENPREDTPNSSASVSESYSPLWFALRSLFDSMTPMEWARTWTQLCAQDSINPGTINDNVVSAFLARCSHSDTLIDVCAHTLRGGISFQRIVDTQAKDDERSRADIVRSSAKADGLDSHYLMDGRKVIAEFLLQLGRQHSMAHARLGVAFVIQSTRDGTIPASRSYLQPLHDIISRAAPSDEQLPSLAEFLSNKDRPLTTFRAIVRSSPRFYSLLRNGSFYDLLGLHTPGANPQTSTSGWGRDLLLSGSFSSTRTRSSPRTPRRSPDLRGLNFETKSKTESDHKTAANPADGTPSVIAKENSDVSHRAEASADGTPSIMATESVDTRTSVPTTIAESSASQSASDMEEVSISQRSTSGTRNVSATGRPSRSKVHPLDLPSVQTDDSLASRTNLPPVESDDSLAARTDFQPVASADSDAANANLPPLESDGPLTSSEDSLAAGTNLPPAENEDADHVPFRSPQAPKLNSFEQRQRAGLSLVQYLARLFADKGADDAPALYRVSDHDGDDTLLVRDEEKFKLKRVLRHASDTNSVSQSVKSMKVKA